MTRKKRKAEFLARLEGGPHDGLALTVAEPLAMLEIPEQPRASYGLRPRDPERDPVHVLRYEYLSGRGHGLAGSGEPNSGEVSP
jgi:hypothetical protein